MCENNVTMNNDLATEKQIKYLRALVDGWYSDPKDRDAILAKLTVGCSLSKRKASNAISILKPLCEVVRESFRIMRCGGNWESYYHSQIDIYDDTDEQILKEIFDSIQVA